MQCGTRPVLPWARWAFVAADLATQTCQIRSLPTGVWACFCELMRGGPRELVYAFHLLAALGALFGTFLNVRPVLKLYSPQGIRVETFLFRSRKGRPGRKDRGLFSPPRLNRLRFCIYEACVSKVIELR